MIGIWFWYLKLQTLEKIEVTNLSDPFFCCFRWKRINSFITAVAIMPDDYTVNKITQSKEIWYKYEVYTLNLLFIPSNILKKESIPVGCVLLACQPHMFWTPDVIASGVCVMGESSSKQVWTGLHDGPQMSLAGTWASGSHILCLGGMVVASGFHVWSRGDGCTVRCSAS